MAEIDREFPGRQVALMLEGQHQTNTRLAAIEADVGTLKTDMGEVKAALVETATRDLMLRILRSFEGQVEVAGIRTELLRETLEARIKATEARLDTLEKA